MGECDDASRADDMSGQRVARGQGTIDERTRALGLLIREQERRSLSQLVHDTIGQRVVALNLTVERLRRHDLPQPAVAAVEVLTEQLGLIETELRDISAGLRLAFKPHQNLLKPFEDLVAYWNRMSGSVCSFTYSGDRSELVPRESLQAAFEITREALTNAFRHNRTISAVEVDMQVADGWCTLSITDNGNGFDAKALNDPPHQEGRFGLRGIRERAAMLGGVVRIQSQVGRGTVITTCLPVPGET